MWAPGEDRGLKGEEDALEGAEKSRQDSERAVLEGGRQAVGPGPAAVPGFDPATVERVKKWAFDRWKEVEALHAQMTIRDDYPTKQEVGRLADKLRALETAVAVNGKDPVVAEKQFKTWAASLEGKVAWQYFIADYRKKKEKKEQEEAQRERERRRGLARQAAVEFRQIYSGAPDPDSQVGTVVSGLVDVQTALVWVGSSGTPNRKYALHGVMLGILTNVRQVEKWKPEVCAEVDVMNTYIVENHISSAAAIVGGDLYFHAETWDDDRNVWKARGACGNCRQWITHIGAAHGG